MERHIVVSLWAEACLYGNYLDPRGGRSNDEWAWFIAHVIPWAAERKFANTAILDKEAEQRYWAGPWEQSYLHSYCSTSQLWASSMAFHDMHLRSGGRPPAEAGNTFANKYV